MTPDSLVQGHVLLRHSLVVLGAVKHQQVHLHTWQVELTSRM